MTGRKLVLPLLMFLLMARAAFPQTEVFKNVVNNLAFYKQKKDLKYLSNAKKSVDSLMKTHKDSVDLAKNVYKLVVYSTIAYIDSTDKLKEPPTFFSEVCKLADDLQKRKKIYRYQPEMDYSRRCIANVYMREGFSYMRISDYHNALRFFSEAQKNAPEFRELNAYIAYANNRVGNLMDAAKYYANLLKADSTDARFIEAASNTYKAIGDTSKALQTLERGRKYLPDDKYLLLDEANIFNNRRNYRGLAPLLSQLLDENPNSSEVAYVAANCYDHLNEYDKAESLYLRSIELNGDAYEPAYNLGVLYLREGVMKHGDNSRQDISRAGQWLEKASEISPNDVKSLQLLEIVYARLGNQHEAERISNKLKLLTNQ